MSRRDWNGPSFHYIVEHNKPGEAPTRVEINDPDRSSYVINADTPFHDYEVTVRAANSLGESTVTPQRVRGRSGEESECF
jgi:hypothetical protein